MVLSNNDVSAQATLKLLVVKATITVASPGTVDWHIQFIKTGIKVEKDKTYRLSFKASSPDIEIGIWELVCQRIQTHGPVTVANLLQLINKKMSIT